MKNLKIIDRSILKDWGKEIFASNNFHMVDVSQKQNTHRKALAMGKIYVGEKTFKLIQNKQMPKGDPISLAEVASLLGVKKTSEIIPLCHPLSVDYSSTKIIQNSDDFSLEAYCVVAAFAKTGVEMEAIMGVNAALITIYDLCKIVNPDLKIDGIRLLIKQGGKTGTWVNPNGLPEFLQDLF
jgi:cyclic pyranopterin phosphate synthase